jgi:hypothetical protein
VNEFSGENTWSRQADTESDRAKQSRLELHWIMSTKTGRRWMHRFLERCGVEAEIFTTNGSTMAHSAGRRSVGLELLADIKAHAKDRYIEMLRENA